MLLFLILLNTMKLCSHTHTQPTKCLFENWNYYLYAPNILNIFAQGSLILGIPGEINQIKVNGK